MKYLFTATFNDGSTLRQTPEDVSFRDPKRSAFYDVLQTPKPVTHFEMSGEGSTYGVDLKTGEFSLGGPYEWMVQDDVPKTPEEYRLIYHRQHRHHFKAGSREQIGHEITYCMGWQTTIDGKNYQQVIGVN